MQQFVQFSWLFARVQEACLSVWLRRCSRTTHSVRPATSCTYSEPHVLR